MAINIKHKLKQFINEGFFHIFGSSVIAKLGGIVSSIVVVRGLPKAEYGHYVDAENLYAYIAIFIGFGISNSIIQYCSENVSDAKRNAIYRFSLKIGFWGNFILCPLILIFSVIKHFSGSLDESLYLPLFLLLPFFTFIDYYHQYVLRAKLNNKEFGRTNMVYTVSHVCGNIIFAKLFGVVGLIVSQYLAHLISATYSFFVLRKNTFYKQVFSGTEKLDKPFIKEFLSYSLISALTTFASTALTLLDVTCLGILLDNAEMLADYKVALTIPTALLFVPKSFMTYYYPKLVKAFSNGRKEGLKEVKIYFAVNIVLNLVISAGIIIFSPLMIQILYGEKYMNVVPVFRILGLNFFFAALRFISAHVISVLKKVKFNLVFTIVSGIVNVGINFALIPLWGNTGAAIATALTSILMLVINICYLVLYFSRYKESPDFFKNRIDPKKSCP